MKLGEVGRTWDTPALDSPLRLWSVMVCHGVPVDRQKIGVRNPKTVLCWGGGWSPPRQASRALPGSTGEGDSRPAPSPTGSQASASVSWGEWAGLPGPPPGAPPGPCRAQSSGCPSGSGSSGGGPRPTLQAARGSAPPHRPPALSPPRGSAGPRGGGRAAPYQADVERVVVILRHGHVHGQGHAVGKDGEQDDGLEGSAASVKE